MKALVKQYPTNARKPEQSEVYIEPQWHDWIQPNGAPLTDENLGYALCEDCPEGIELDAKDFGVIELTKTVPSDIPEDEPVTVKYWKAIYIGRPDEGVQPDSQMEII